MVTISDAVSIDSNYQDTIDSAQSVKDSGTKDSGTNVIQYISSEKLLELAMQNPSLDIEG